MTEKASRSMARDDAEADLYRRLELFVHRPQVFSKLLETSLQGILSRSETGDLAGDLVVQGLSLLNPAQNGRKWSRESRFVSQVTHKRRSAKIKTTEGMTDCRYLVCQKRLWRRTRASSPSSPRGRQSAPRAPRSRSGSRAGVPYTMVLAKT